MNRNEFLKKSALLGAGIALFPSIISSCGKEEITIGNPLDFDGDVLIIGGGAAGMMAGYRLAQNNINFRIIEASGTLGGRVKRISSFADFPIDLGAEWLHTHPRVFGQMINDPSVKGNIDLIPYNPQSVKSYSDGQLYNVSLFNTFYAEYKFKNTTWFDFFEDYIIPSLSGNVILNSPVETIDYSSDRISVSTSNGNTYQADKVLITVPITILQNESITFTPALPQVKQDAIDAFDMPNGIKVFLEFSERFYPDILMLDSGSDAAGAERIYYDAAFKKNSNRNVLGLFTVGTGAAQYTDLESEEAIIEKMLDELDEIFDNKASQSYIKHVIQNWSAEPYIQGSYSFNDPTDAKDELIAGVSNKLFFAGEAITSGDYATVHGAGLAGFDRVEQMVSS